MNIILTVSSIPLFFNNVTNSACKRKPETQRKLPLVSIHRHLHKHIYGSRSQSTLNAREHVERAWPLTPTPMSSFPQDSAANAQCCWEGKKEWREGGRKGEGDKERESRARKFRARFLARIWQEKIKANSGLELLYRLLFIKLPALELLCYCRLARSLAFLTFFTTDHISSSDL